MTTKKRWGEPPKIMIAAVPILVLFLIILLTATGEKRSRRTVDGDYSNKFQINGSASNVIVVKYHFDSADGTCEESWGDTVLMTGRYSVDKNIVKVVTDGNETSGAKSETFEFLVEDDVLIPADYLYEGEIPEGETFDAVVSMTDSAGMAYRITFSGDGSYIYTVENSSGEADTDFIYRREGNYIHRYKEDGDALTDFYICGNRLAGIYYRKQ